MPSVAPFEVRPPEVEDGRSWAALPASAALHILIVLLLLFRLPSTPKPVVERQPGEAIERIALSPPQKTPEQTQQPKPQPPVQQQILGPDTKVPAVVPKEATPPPPPPIPDSPAPPPPSPTKAPDPAPTPPETADHILKPNELGAASRFMPKPVSPLGAPGSSIRAVKPSVTTGMTPGSAGRAGMSAKDNRNWEPSMETIGKCVEIPDLGTNPDGSPVLSSLNGTVYDEAGIPLSNAFLRIEGTRFSTFTSGTGQYRLEFDPKLLDRCRIQYVSVIREGFATQHLMLAIGARTQSDDIQMRKH